jgi:hypothetical protein
MQVTRNHQLLHEPEATQSKACKLDSQQEAQNGIQYRSEFQV